jgi:hypothetical protein
MGLVDFLGFGRERERENAKEKKFFFLCLCMPRGEKLIVLCSCDMYLNQLVDATLQIFNLS